MASSSSSTFLFRNSCTYTFTYILILTFSAPAKHALGYCYTSIISIGDSLADTGNLLRLLENSSADQPPHFSLPPYGKTYFHRPTGRFSDGRLVIDFIAQHLGLPLVPPYFWGQNASSVKFQGGVNFAVGGATALEDEFFEERGIHIPYKNVSLGMQLGWFKEMLPSLCHTPLDCKKLLESSLILMGEIGGNDYNNALYVRRSLEEMQSFVTPVVEVIAWAINELIELGAMALMVPGNLPIGCLPVYLTEYTSPNKENYDPETGCLIWLNEFAEYHNEMLRIELSRIQQQHPHLTIIYADYYNSAMLFYRSPSSYGFSSATTLSACCGGGGQYNYNSSIACGYPSSRDCDDPSLYINWDGLHLTEAAYKWLSKGLMEGPYSIPPIDASCHSLFELIELGAVTLIVPGNLPSECSPSLLTRFASSIKEDYDPETGCLVPLNEFSKYHNQMLRKELDRIQELYPHTTILYAYYYNAAIRFYRSRIKFGFKGRALSACCGLGRPYNFNSSAQCGSSPSRACDDPSSYISWDGIHFTEAAYKLISKGLSEGPYTVPHIKNPCITLPFGWVGWASGSYELGCASGQDFTENVLPGSDWRRLRANPVQPVPIPSEHTGPNPICCTTCNECS